jgi:hypothetical protein
MIRDEPEREVAELDNIADGLIEDICSGCGIESSKWKGNQGRGYMKNGQIYCCRDCAADVECNCLV